MVKSSERFAQIGQLFSSFIFAFLSNFRSLTFSKGVGKLLDGWSIVPPNNYSSGRQKNLSRQFLSNQNNPSRQKERSTWRKLGWTRIRRRRTRSNHPVDIIFHINFIFIIKTHPATYFSVPSPCCWPLGGRNQWINNNLSASMVTCSWMIRHTPTLCLGPTRCCCSPNSIGISQSPA